MYNVGRLFNQKLNKGGSKSIYYGEYPDKVYGIYLRRFDISGETCQNCIANATDRLVKGLLPNLLTEDCRACHNEAVYNAFVIVKGKKGGRYLNPSCDLRRGKAPVGTPLDQPLPTDSGNNGGVGIEGKQSMDSNSYNNINSLSRPRFHLLKIGCMDKVQDEEIEHRKCGRCGQLGHNRQKCKDKFLYPIKMETLEVAGWHETLFMLYSKVTDRPFMSHGTSAKNILADLMEVL
ncbi:hypothetical protein QYF36_023814 [Acer negundo]|nr:hypothetical protein QYF36_023814 [Acer negundo]